MEAKIGFYSKDGICNVTPKEAFELCENGAILLDIREEYLNLFKQFDVPYVLQIPKSVIKSSLSKLTKNELFIIADASSIYSREVSEILLSNGFNVLNLAGGIVEWEHDGLPLLIDKKERLSGSCMCQLKPRG